MLEASAVVVSASAATLFASTSATILLGNVSRVCPARRSDADGTEIIAGEFARQPNTLFKIFAEISELYLHRCVRDIQLCCRFMVILLEHRLPERP